MESGDRLPKESILLKQGGREYQDALLCLVQRLYRPAFTALRLSLELTIAALFYSAHTIRLDEWLCNRTDINWKRLTTSNGGVFTERFVRAFAPDLITESAHFGSIATKTIQRVLRVYTWQARSNSGDTNTD